MIEKINPYVLVKCIDDEAKLYFYSTLAVSLATFAMGVIGVFYPKCAPFLVWIAVPSGVMAFLGTWWFDDTRGQAQELRRKLDLQDGFGWLIPPEYLSERMLKTSDKVRQLVMADSESEPYFASKEPEGARRMLENIRESSW